MGLGLLPTVAQPESDIVAERTGTRIGRYKLLEKIGEGGFGVVFMAEQVEPVQRKVALKIIKAGMDTREVIARFEAERQAIALMEHPNIARVLDAGATEAGRPYFVMELVRGIPITDYCDQANLPTQERLQLFMKVCQAVQHAHQKGVIHRDLKPTNVLVTEHDGQPVPKVIDFGVAKALGHKLTEKTLFTGFQQMIGTPAYMSPEQAALSGLDIDTRADIYSLGVLLYELLTGATPFDADALRKAAMDEIRRTICEREPQKPSTRLHTLGDKLAAVAKHRGTLPAALSRIIRGDLDWIVMKCLEKDRARRYDTPNALSADLMRHLNNDPVLAGPPSTIYCLGKLVRKHLMAVGLFGVLMLAWAVFVLFGLDLLARRQTIIREFAAVGTFVAHNGTAALAFNNQSDAEDVLSFFRVERRIVRAAFYDAQGKLLARYPRAAPANAFPEVPEKPGFRFDHSHAILSQPVVVDSMRLGSLYLELDVKAENQRFQLYLVIFLLLVVLSLLVIHLLARWQRRSHRQLEQL